MSARSLQPIDSFASFKVVEMQIEQAVKAGQLTKEKAREILEEARKNYRNQSYNREIERYK